MTNPSSEAIPTGARLTIGNAHLDWLHIAVRSRSHPSATDFWDGGWLRTPITGSIGGFLISIPDAQLRSDELHQFMNELHALCQHLTGTARLRSLEDWIDLTITGDGSGRLIVEGAVSDCPGIGNELSFTINGYDQTFLPDLVAQLNEVMTSYPVPGRPTD